jgi:hypothetical protein
MAPNATIIEHLRAVRRHWVALVTGSLPIAAYTVLVLGLPDVPGKTWHFWNHLPPWFVWSLALLGVIWAQFLAWRDMKAERDTLTAQIAVLPRLNPLLILEIAGVLVLPIKNRGTTARVWAKMTIQGSVPRGKSNVFATWRGSSSKEMTVGSGDTEEIVIAESGGPHTETGPESLDYYWYVPFIEEGERKQLRSLFASVPDHPHPKSVVEVKVTVFSDPPSSGEPISCTVKLLGCDQWQIAGGNVASRPPQDPQNSGGE